jgi:pyridoxal/pyridoxine/pyridoxamine kinase
MRVATNMMEYTEWRVLSVPTFLVSIRPGHYPCGGQ